MDSLASAVARARTRKCFPWRNCVSEPGESERRSPYVTRGEGWHEDTSRNGTWTPGVEEAAGRLGGRRTGGTVVRGHSLLREGKEAHTSLPTQVLSNFPPAPPPRFFLSNEISLNDVMQTKLVS